MDDAHCIAIFEWNSKVKKTAGMPLATGKGS